MQGKTINGFTLQHLLGAGGMAEVWYAENKIGKKAAVKILLPKLCQDETVTSRFFTEAKVMVSLDYPNIREVYDYGDIDGRPAIVMEYLEGDDLKARMKHGQRFTDEELQHWWNQLVSALNYTHQQGIVHRDIKPGNIFVDKDGNVKLLDFGIAKVRDSISRTQTGQMLGTLVYMSPEQVKDSKHIDYRTDVYSLAVTFVHLVTGEKPYAIDTSSNFEIREQIVYKPVDLSGLPMIWRSLLEPYLEKDPSRRPALRTFNDNPLQDEYRSSEAEEQARRRLARQNAQSVRAETNAPDELVTQKERHGFVSVWLVIMIVTNIFTTMTNLIAGFEAINSYSPPLWVYFCSSALCLLNVVAAVLLLNWKKIGFWMIAVSAACSMLINLYAVGVGFVWISLIGVGILWAVLQIRKNGISCWKQLE